MNVLVLGASGATGKLVVTQLLKRKISVRALVRDNAIVSAETLADPLLELVRGNISELNDSQVITLVQDCDAIISCLGHNISFKGMFGKPRNLVSDAIKKMFEVVIARSDNKDKTHSDEYDCLHEFQIWREKYHWRKNYFFYHLSASSSPSR